MRAPARAWTSCGSSCAKPTRARRRSTRSWGSGATSRRRRRRRGGTRGWIPRARAPSGCGSRLARGAHAPDDVAHVVGDEERALPVDRDTHGTAVGLVALEEPREDVDGLARGLAAGERHEHDLVAHARLAVPRAVLADEGALG